MILVNTDYISGKELETIGLVKGCKLMSIKLFLNNRMITSYKGIMHAVIELATEEMIEEAKKVGADGIVNIKYSYAATGYTIEYISEDATKNQSEEGTSEVVVYGTAVKFKKRWIDRIFKRV